MPEGVVRRIHRMPFGAEPTADGVRFRLWAPGARRVDLLLGDEAPPAGRPLERREQGWFELLAADAAPGSPYRFAIDGKTAVPDPASRHQPRDVHGPSLVVDPLAFGWADAGWRGRPWEEAVLYELHVGAFSREGGFDGVRRRLDHLAALGVTAIELMPLADFPGRRNWGYDGVLPFAPDARYGPPESLKRLVVEAHARGLMVLIDVVYNHFGPEGNYLHLYAPPFFRGDRRTPWGEAIDFEGPQREDVRGFFVHNALYWLEELHLDGLRIDAVHAIHDDSRPSFLDDLARAVREGPGRERQVHLVLENVANQAHRLRREAGRPAYDAQWNDDAHHALHCLLTGEADGYYADFADAPERHLARALAEGFAFQGQPSGFHHGRPRGEPSRHLPLAAFVNFLQNHDQVGNRAFGQRLASLVDEARLRAATAVLLLAPSPPLLFMGEEWGSTRPFLFFCDLGPELGPLVREGRRREFARFPAFRDPAARERIPDPCAGETFSDSCLDWERLEQAAGRRWLELHRTLLALRRSEIVPRLTGVSGQDARWRALGGRAIRVDWRLADGAELTLLANLDGAPADLPRPAAGRLLHAEGASDGPLGPWNVRWFLDATRRNSHG